MDEKKPNKKELIALNLFYNRFYDIYEEIHNDETFYKKSACERFYKIRDIFSIYRELLGYEPIRSYLDYMKHGARPPMEGIIAEDLFSFIRHLLLHYPLFEKWEDVYITEELATWNKKGAIHKFLIKCTAIKIGQGKTVRYRIWSHSKKKMTYININFPEQCKSDDKVYLKDIISEKEGILFCISLMKQVLDSQVENKDNSDMVNMSQVYISSKKV